MDGNRAEERMMSLAVNLSDGQWFPIPEYAGRYFINQDGRVCNTAGHIIKPVESKDGPRVELRKYGQREKILVIDLLQKTEYDTLGGDSNEDD